jgi:transcriptional regulator with XRE-family HTH domain
VAIMPGVRRPSRAIEADRLGRELRARIGTDIQRLRERRGLTRIELARRAGLGRMVESRIERGVANPDLDALQRIAIALDRPLIVSFGGRDPHEQPPDAGHLAMQELVLRLGRAAGYDGSFELQTRPMEPWRSADVGLAATATGRLIDVECWNTFGDIGAAVRSSHRKQAELRDLAIARWGAAGTSHLVWVVRATARNRALVARYPEVFARAFPGSSRRWVDALTGGAIPPGEPGMVWADVGGTRLVPWRKRTV